MEHVHADGLEAHTEGRVKEGVSVRTRGLGAAAPEDYFHGEAAEAVKKANIRQPGAGFETVALGKAKGRDAPRESPASRPVPALVEAKSWEECPMGLRREDDAALRGCASSRVSGAGLKVVGEGRGCKIGEAEECIPGTGTQEAGVRRA